MKIYETLKDVLSAEQLEEFKKEVQETISEEIEQKTAWLNKKAEEYVEMVVEEKTNELTAKADEYCELRINEEKQALVEEYDQKMNELESNVVESLDHFLESEISEKISDQLLEDVAKRQALQPLVEDIMDAFERHYVSIDSDGNRQIEELKEENAKLEKEVSKQLAEKVELSKLAETAAAKLLISEKTQDLTEGQQKKVQMFFEGKDFDTISEKIDGYIALISEESENKTDKEESRGMIDEDVDGFDEKSLVENKVEDEDASFFSRVESFLGE